MCEHSAQYMSIKVFFPKGTFYMAYSVRNHSNSWAFLEFRALTEDAMLAADLGEKENIVIYGIWKNAMVADKPIWHMPTWGLCASVCKHLVGNIWWGTTISLCCLGFPDQVARDQDNWDSDDTSTHSSCKMIGMTGLLPVHGKIILLDTGRMLI